MPGLRQHVLNDLRRRATSKPGLSSPLASVAAIQADETRAGASSRARTIQAKPAAWAPFPLVAIRGGTS